MNIKKIFQVILKYISGIIYSVCNCVRLIHQNSAIKVEVEPNKILTEQELKEGQNTSNILIELVC